MENITTPKDNINGNIVLSAKKAKIRGPRCLPLSRRLQEDRDADRRAAQAIRAKGIERPRRKLNLPESELIVLAKRGDPDARWTLADNYRGHIAERIGAWNSTHTSALTYDDKWQAANIGFLRGVDAYDPSLGHVLATCTRFWILAELNKAADDADPAFATRNLRQGKTETVEEFEARRGGARNVNRPMSAGDIFGLNKSNSRDDDDEGDKVQKINLIQENAFEHNEFDGLNGLERNEFLERHRPQKIRIALSNLKHRDRRIIEGRYLSDPPITCADLGRELGVTPQRINQLEQRAYRDFVMEVKRADVPEEEPSAEYLFKPDNPQFEYWTRLPATPEELADLFARWADEQSDVAAALQSLDALDRQLIEARFLREPLSRLAEAARFHKISYLKTVSRIKRALRMLQERRDEKPVRLQSLKEQIGNISAQVSA